ncbi:MAG: hypothetical protein KGN79_00670 [Acidobacteriota bacterium]|nr:hypothetical protein [Acidobacteriota bacterium]
MFDPKEDPQEVYRRYAALARRLDPEHGLGGKLLFADELNASSIQLVRAANIAGAASFLTSSDNAALRQAMRDGVVDFVVTTLDETLRILKNEIRKKQAVSVGIYCADIAAFAWEMQERGVQPDLPAAGAEPLDDACEWVALDLPAGDKSFASKLDAVVLGAVPAEDYAAHRWYRMSPRYLPRAFRNLRTVACSRDAARKIQSWYEQAAHA